MHACTIVIVPAEVAVEIILAFLNLIVNNDVV